MAIEKDLVQAIPVQVCERFGILAVGREPGSEALVIATADPANVEHLRAVSVAVGQAVVAAAATADAIERGIRRHYYGEEPKTREQDGAADDPFGPPDEAPTAAAPGSEYAALLARLEHLEQQTHAREAQILAVLRAIGDILVEKGLVSREEYLRRVREK
jgi:hypothetical protein